VTTMVPRRSSGDTKVAPDGGLRKLSTAKCLAAHGAGEN
jgi:hypothetical protein